MNRKLREREKRVWMMLKVGSREEGSGMWKVGASENWGQADTSTTLNVTANEALAPH